MIFRLKMYVVVVRDSLSNTISTHFPDSFKKYFFKNFLLFIQRNTVSRSGYIMNQNLIQEFYCRRNSTDRRIDKPDEFQITISQFYF